MKNQLRKMDCALQRAKSRLMEKREAECFQKVTEHTDQVSFGNRQGECFLTFSFPKEGRGNFVEKLDQLGCEYYLCMDLNALSLEEQLDFKQERKAPIQYFSLLIIIGEFYLQTFLHSLGEFYLQTFLHSLIFLHSLATKAYPFPSSIKNFCKLERILFSRSLSVKSVFCENPKNSATTGFLINSNLSF